MRYTVLAAALIVSLGVAAGGAQTDRGAISGKIVKEKPRQPVVDAIVKFTLERSPAGFRRTTKSRPPDGRFSDEMPQGWVLVSVFKKDEDGSIWVGKDRVKVDTNYGAAIPEIRLAQQKGEGAGASSGINRPAPVVIEGVLSGGAALAGGFISVNDIETGEEVAATSVTSDGWYSIVLPSNRDYLFTAMAEEHEAKVLVVTVHESARLDIPLGP
jgi:hypothetical protein